jgi:hypothetical protein
MFSEWKQSTFLMKIFYDKLMRKRETTARCASVSSQNLSFESTSSHETINTMLLQFLVFSHSTLSFFCRRRRLIVSFTLLPNFFSCYLTATK